MKLWGALVVAVCLAVDSGVAYGKNVWQEIFEHEERAADHRAKARQEMQLGRVLLEKKRADEAAEHFQVARAEQEEVLKELDIVRDLKALLKKNKMMRNVAYRPRPNS